MFRGLLTKFVSYPVTERNYETVSPPCLTLAATLVVRVREMRTRLVVPLLVDAAKPHLHDLVLFETRRGPMGEPALTVTLQQQPHLAAAAAANALVTAADEGPNLRVWEPEEG